MKGIAAIVACFAIGCASPTPVHEDAVASHEPPPRDEPLASAVPSVTATASAITSASSAPELPIRSTTPGKIQCQAVDCDAATEVCCITYASAGTAGHCAPKPKPGESSPCCDSGVSYSCGRDGSKEDRRCDEAADCGTRQRCCTLPMTDFGLATQECVDSCETWEACLPGSTCPSGGACEAPPGAREGSCPLQIKPAVCGKTTCQLGEACCWNPEAGTGRCAEDCGAGETSFECTAPDQCAPYACDRESARFDCGGDAFKFAVLCKTKKDCPPYLTAHGGPISGPPRGATSCSQTKGLPPGVKECVYE